MLKNPPRRASITAVLPRRMGETLFNVWATPPQAAERARKNRSEGDQHVATHREDEQRADERGKGHGEEIGQALPDEPSPSDHGGHGRGHRTPAMRAPIR